MADPLRSQMVDNVVRAEERVRDLSPSANSEEKQRAFMALGHARKVLEDYDRDSRELGPSVAQQAQDTLAQKCLALRRQLADLEGKPNVAADVEVIEEQLATEWAQLGREGRQWVNKNALKRR